MTRNAFYLVGLALSLGLAMWVSTASALPAGQGCSEPSPGGSLDCGVFLGDGSDINGNPNAPNPILWNDDVDEPEFGDVSFTAYDLVAQWEWNSDLGQGEWDPGYAVGNVDVDGGDPHWGTWQLPVTADLMAIKGGPGYALYFVDAATAGYWSSYFGVPLVGNGPPDGGGPPDGRGPQNGGGSSNSDGNTPAVSNIRWFSSESTPVPVPVPGPLALVGAGLLGLGLTRLRLRR